MKIRKNSSVNIEKEIESFGELLTVNSPKVPDIKKPKRKIKRKGSQPTLINYFTHQTQEYIVEYQKELEIEKKKTIYVKNILPAFDSLVENLINVYGFSVMYESKQDLKNECLQFLYGAVDKFDAEKGSKAFSYFNVVAKNWLTIKSKQNMKRIQNYISIDDHENISKEDLERIEAYHFAPNFEDSLLAINMQDYLIDLVMNIENRIQNDNEKLVVNAIRTLMDNIDHVDLLSKRAILLYIRELTNLSSKQLSLTLTSLKKHYRTVKAEQEV